MMIICRDIISFIEKTAPCELAEDWDNIGLLVGNKESKVKRIMLCLDITTASLEKAVENKVNLIITHHPLIFKGLNRVVENEVKGSLIYTLIRNNINVYAAHTNLDFAVSGVNTQLAEALGLEDVAPYGDSAGKAGTLKEKVSLHDFIKQVKCGLNVPFVRVAGKAEDGVQKVAVYCGSFDDNLEALSQSQADVLVTGDLKYHTALDAREAGLCIIDAGHFNTEKVVLPALETVLKDNFPGIEVIRFEQEEDPFKSY